MDSRSENLKVPMKELVKHNTQKDVFKKLEKEQSRFSFPEAVAIEYIGSSKGKDRERKEQNLKKCQEEIIKEIRNFQERQEGSLDENKRWFVAVDYLRNRKPRLPKLLRAFEDCFIGNFLDDLGKKANVLKDALKAKMDNKQMPEKDALAFEEEIDSIIGKVNDGVDKNEKDEKKYPNKDLLDALAEAMAELGKKEKKLSLTGKREKRGKENKKQYRREPERADKEKLKEEFQLGKIWKADENKKKDGSYFDFIVQGFDDKDKKLLNVILIKKGGKRSYTLIPPKALRRIKESGKYKVFEMFREERKKMTSEKEELNEELKIEEDKEKYKSIRQAAEITLNKIKKWEELNADTEKEGDEKFKQKSRELWKNFVTHGRLRFDKKTGEPIIENHTDLDGKISIKLLNMAGFDVDEKNIEYVAPGGQSKEPGKFHIDTGGKDGIVILKDGTVFIDHHGPGSDNNVSAAKFTYEILTGLGLLEKKKYLDDLVNFVTQVDNFKYPEEKKYFKNYFENSWRTLLGLYRMASADNLINFFKYRKYKSGKKLSPAEPLTDGLLKKFGFIYKKGKKEFNKSESHKKRVERSLEELQNMEKEGFIIDSDYYGKIAINIGGRIPTGIDGAKAFGCGAIVLWNPESDSFFISDLRGKPLRNKFRQGINVRKTMWVKPANEEKLSNIKLGEILKEMTNGKFEPRGKLKEYLEKEKQTETKEQKFTEKEREVIGVLVEYAKKFQEKLEAEADWTGYSDKQKNDTLEIQTAVSVNLKMKEKKLFAGKADEVSKMVLEKIK